MKCDSHTTKVPSHRFCWQHRNWNSWPLLSPFVLSGRRTNQGGTWPKLITVALRTFWTDGFLVNSKNSAAETKSVLFSLGFSIFHSKFAPSTLQHLNKILRKIIVVYQLGDPGEKGTFEFHQKRSRFSATMGSFKGNTITSADRRLTRVTLVKCRPQRSCFSPSSRPPLYQITHFASVIHNSRT